MGEKKKKSRLMIKDFQTYINEGLFDRNQSEFNIRKTDKGIEHVYS